MQKVYVNVRGVRRKIYKEKYLGNGSWRARAYRGSDVISGTLSKNSLGVYRFIPMGVNASLV